MKLLEFKNESGLEFKDISTEEYRIYQFEDDCIIKIEEPLWLNVNYKSGGHRLCDAQGISHYIPPGWVHLSWKAKEGKAHFSF